MTTVATTARSRSRRFGRDRRLARGVVPALSWAVVAAFLVLALIGPWLVTADPLRQTGDALLAAGSPGHLLGTDDLGRDQLARLVYGARPLLTVALLSTAVAMLLGTALGVLAGYLGGRWEGVLMRFTDVGLAFPSVLLIILVVAATGPGALGLVLGIGVSLAFGTARLARALAAREAARDYVLATRLAGTRAPRVMLQEVLPNMAGPMLVQVATTVSVAAGFAAGLSYLGLGIQPPTPDWGYMVQAGQEFVYNRPLLVALPALATLVFVVACNFVGDDLRDALDPRASR